jgi:tetratricopeptide (TPR) repeat protein
MHWAVRVHLQVAVAREMDYQVIKGFALHNLGESYRAIGEPGTSADCFRRALSVRQYTGDRHGQAQTLRALGDLLQELREADAARASWQQALAIFEELGDRQAGELRARLRALGHTKRRLAV